MASRGPLGCLPVALLAMSTWMACGDDDAEVKKSPAKATPNLDQRCEQLGMACGDQGKHVGKLAEQCAQAAKEQIDKGCAAKAVAVYDCYEKELCGKAEKVWALRDFN